MNGHKPGTFEDSSGNVFADLGLPHADTLLVKTRLMLHIRDEITARGWDTSRAAIAFDLPAHVVAQLDAGDPDAFAVETLAEMLVALGYDVALRVAPRTGDTAQFAADLCTSETAALLSATR